VVNLYAVNIDGTTGIMSISTINRAPIFSFFVCFTGDFIDFYDQNNTLQKINTPAKLFGFRIPIISIMAPLLGAECSRFRFSLKPTTSINSDNTQDLNTIERSVD
jgi:hypothetical protein